MSGITKNSTGHLLTDASGLPAPQYSNTAGTGFELVEGTNGSMFAQIMDSTGTPLFTSTNGANVLTHRASVTPNHTATIAYTSLTGTNNTATISTTRNAMYRAVAIFNTTNVSFSSVVISFYDTTFPSISGLLLSGSSSAFSPNGAVVANGYAVYSSSDSPTAGVLLTPFNQMLIRVNYSSAPTSGNLDIYLAEIL